VNKGNQSKQESARDATRMLWNAVLSIALLVFFVLIEPPLSILGWLLIFVVAVMLVSITQSAMNIRRSDHFSQK
jgi:uncharacterized membrane protein YgaE (UPF0421/DUF939 family)